MTSIYLPFITAGEHPVVDIEDIICTPIPLLLSIQIISSPNSKGRRKAEACPKDFKMNGTMQPFSEHWWRTFHLQGTQRQQVTVPRMHTPHTGTNTNPRTASGPLTTCPCPRTQLLALPWLRTAARSSRGSSAWRPRSCPITLHNHHQVTPAPLAPIPRYRVPSLASGLCKPKSPLFPHV